MQQKKEFFLFTIFRALIQPIIDWANSSVDRRSTQSLVNETLQGNNLAFQNTMSAIQNSGGNLAIVLDQLAVQQTYMRAAESAVKNATAKAEKLKVGTPERLAADKIVAAKMMTYNSWRSAVEITSASAKKASGAQDSLQTQVAVGQANRKAQESVLISDAMLEQTNQSLVQLYQNQLRAAGFLGNQDGDIPNYTSEVHRRRVKSQGEAEALSQMVTNLLGASADGHTIDVSDEEVDLIAQAYQMSGKSVPTTTADSNSSSAQQ